MDYLKIYNTLDSTNKEAQRLLAAGPVPNGLTILARQQTQGRGQYGRTWLAEENAHLAMSIVLKPARMKTSELPMIGMKVSLAIVRALQSIHSSLHPNIKWPNDIYLKQKKVCGILIENALFGTSIQHTIIGIGLNVNEKSFPEDLSNATSLAITTGQSHNTDDLAILLRKHILELLDDQDKAWKKEYHTLLYGLGQNHPFDIAEGRFHGVISGVTDEGKILLSLPDGTQQSYASHEIKWVL